MQSSGVPLAVPTAATSRITASSLFRHTGSLFTSPIVSAPAVVVSANGARKDSFVQRIFISSATNWTGEAKLSEFLDRGRQPALADRRERKADGHPAMNDFPRRGPFRLHADACRNDSVMPKARPQQRDMVYPIQQRNDRAKLLRIHGDAAQRRIELRGLHRDPQHIVWRCNARSAIDRHAE